MDVLTEIFANNRGELRFAITPSVVQHIGKISSKRNSHGPIMKHGIWSFAFEQYDWQKLRKEHDNMAGETRDHGTNVNSPDI
jgi:hypothetical protein